MKTAVNSPSIDRTPLDLDRTSYDVFIPEDWKEFADWCLNTKDDGVTTPIYEFKQQLKSPTNVNPFNYQFSTIKSDGLYRTDTDSEIWCLTILMLCAAIESGDTFL